MAHAKEGYVNIPIFLSYPKPIHGKQRQFIDRIQEHLKSHGLEGRTLGVTDYDMDAPLKAIRRLMIECNGLITVAFRRTYIEKGTTRYRVDIENLTEEPISDVWLTSPWAQIEPAMAYQLGLPVLIFREAGVLADGLLEKGIVGTYMPEFNLDQAAQDYLTSGEWGGVIGKWEGYVRSVVDKKGNPPQLY